MRCLFPLILIRRNGRCPVPVSADRLTVHALREMIAQGMDGRCLHRALEPGLELGKNNPARTRPEVMPGNIVRQLQQIGEPVLTDLPPFTQPRLTIPYHGWLCTTRP